MLGLRTTAMVVVVIFALTTVDGQNVGTGPAFMWGSTSHMACKETGKASRVAYEVIYCLGALISCLEYTAEACAFLQAGLLPRWTSICWAFCHHP
jgi:hypothetical protein